LRHNIFRKGDTHVKMSSIVHCLEIHLERGIRTLFVYSKHTDEDY